jgi:hypothetical protein
MRQPGLAIFLAFTCVPVLASGISAAAAPSAFSSPELTATVSGSPREGVDVESPEALGPNAKAACEEERDTIVGVTELVLGLGGLAGTIAYWRSPQGTRHKVSAWIVLPSYPLSAILGAAIGYRLGLFISPSCR